MSDNRKITGFILIFMGLMLGLIEEVVAGFPMILVGFPMIVAGAIFLFHGEKTGKI